MAITSLAGCKDIPGEFHGSGEPEWRSFRRSSSGLISDTILTIFVSLQNEKWIGTHLGVSRFAGDRWVTFTTADGLASNRVQAITQGRDGSMWFGTGGSGVTRFNPLLPHTPWQSYATVDGLPDEFVHSIRLDKLGDIWFATNGGVGRFRPVGSEHGVWSSFGITDGLPANIITALAVDAANIIWVGTVSTGAARYDGISWAHVPLPVEFQRRITSIAVDGMNSKWFGTWNGAFRLTSSGSWRAFNVEDGLAHSWINSISIDSRGNVWFGTNAGVSKFDGIQWTSYTTTNSELLNDTVTCVTTDIRGNLWFGTVSGINQFNEHGIR